MTDILKVGDLAYVIDILGIRPNLVRTEPEIDENNRKHNVIGKIPENAVLAILPGPVRWPLDYPYDDGVHIWYRVRGRTDEKGPDGRFKIVEGWTAASEQGKSLLRRIDTSNACPENDATFVTHLQDG